MRRTQVYLHDAELELLDCMRRATGASRSELIRCAVRHTFGEMTKSERLRALDASAEAWLLTSAPGGTTRRRAPTPTASAAR